jgi:hypothetical protein
VTCLEEKERHITCFCALVSTELGKAATLRSHTWFRGSSHMHGLVRRSCFVSGCSVALRPFQCPRDFLNELCHVQTNGPLLPSLRSYTQTNQGARYCLHRRGYAAKAKQVTLFQRRVLERDDERHCARVSQMVTTPACVCNHN